MSKQDLLKELFAKFLDDKKMTSAEIRQLQGLVQDERNHALLEQLLASLYEEEAGEPVTGENNARTAFEEVWAKLQVPEPVSMPDAAVVAVLPRRREWWKYAAAAAVVLAVGTSVFWLMSRKPANPIVQQEQLPETGIQPGGNKAILVLADGSRIVLDSAANGTLARQGSAVVIKKADGQLAYDSNTLTTHHSPLTFNTLSTPRGGQYRLTLPDGSKVWLNAASSIKYPTSFTGNERRVALTGEAYFEIASLSQTLPQGRDKLSGAGGGGKMPFIVDILPAEGEGRGGQVEVLGTHFNINAYEEENVIKTTLLEGKVKVTAGNRKSEAGSQTSDFRYQTAAFLKPGQQASMPVSAQSGQSPKITVQTADADAAVAWKNDLIQFEGHDIYAAMRMIARWYDVEVEYRGNVPNVHFRGAIASNVPVSQVLDMMGKTEEVHFAISGRKIVVTK